MLGAIVITHNNEMQSVIIGIIAAIIFLLESAKNPANNAPNNGAKSIIAINIDTLYSRIRYILSKSKFLLDRYQSISNPRPITALDAAIAIMKNTTISPLISL